MAPTLRVHNWKFEAGGLKEKVENVTGEYAGMAAKSPVAPGRTPGSPLNGPVNEVKAVAVLNGPFNVAPPKKLMEPLKYIWACTAMPVTIANSMVPPPMSFFKKLVFINKRFFLSAC